MFLKYFISLNLVFFLVSSSISQGTGNEFVIGMFMFDKMEINAMPPSTLSISNNNSSQLNVLSEDGFNVVSNYPTMWRNQQYFEKELDLIKLNGLKFMPTINEFYKPNTNLLLPGVNIYNSTLGDRPNYDLMFDNIFNNPLYSDVLWGHQICEESTAFNLKNPTSDPPAGGWPHSNYIESELPLPFVLSAIEHFEQKKQQNNIVGQPLIVMEASHSRAYTSNLIYDLENNDINNHYTPKHTIESIPQEVVFFEGSYSIIQSNWSSQSYGTIFGSGPQNIHYLGTFKSIDFAKTHIDRVHDVLYNSMSESNDPLHYHSNLSIQNANYMWFKAYNSIIHGVEGIWFWALPASWKPGEKPSGWDTDPTRFSRNNFPELYKNFTSHLAQELRFLVDRNLLSSDENSIIYEKKDEADKNCIVPNAWSYIPAYYGSINLNAQRNENYGLRYSIRTNGDEVIMIITNPVNVPITATLEFNHLGNQIIRNSTGVDVLFETSGSVTSSTYKTNRNTNIDLINSTVGSQYYKPFESNKTLTLNFGPLDVHVLKFTSSSPISYNNGWEREWSNFGNGKLGSLIVSDFDEFLPGDFDGDGEDELLCIQQKVGNPYTNIATMLKFVNGDWVVKWSNLGSNTISWWSILYKDKFVVGDFDGDGADELLCIQAEGTTNNYATMLQFGTNDWTSTNVWSNYGDNTMSWWGIRPLDKFIAGDFDGDLKDELFCIQGESNTNSYVTMLQFGSSDWENNGVWSNYGNGSIGSWGVRIQDRFISGNFDNLGQDQLLCVQGDGSYSTLLTKNGSSWTNSWSNGGVNFFGSWPTPVLSTDQILVGNLDDYDTRDEILFIQTGVNANNATSMDKKTILSKPGWNTNWVANNSTSNPYIHDWRLSEGDKYLLFKTNSSSNQNHLLTFRNYSCTNDYNSTSNKYLVNLYKSTNGSNKILESQDVNFFADYEERLKIFPNPSYGEFRIHLSNYEPQSEEIVLELFSTSGQFVESKIVKSEDLTNSLVSFSNLDIGLYILKIRGDQIDVVRRITILQK